MTAKPPKLLRPAQVQAILRCGRSTLHDYANQGRLEFVRTLGGHRRYPADQPAIIAALKGRR